MSPTSLRKTVTPRDNLQDALDGASPGDALVLSPGTYYQDLTIRKGGTADSPVTLRAATPGEVAIHGGLPPSSARPDFGGPQAPARPEKALCYTL